MAKQVTDNQKFAGARLPTSVKPIHYELSLKPDLESFTFDGTVKIEYKADSAVNKIVLNAIDLEITEGYTQSKDGGADSSPLSLVTYSPESETATLEFEASELPSSGFLSLKFKGILNDKMKGFYRTSFKLHNQTVNAATTQFEAVDARRSFPCWDEPACKATFTVDLTTDCTLKVVDENSTEHTYPIVVLSNMPAKQVSELGDGKKRTYFDKTPIMSTYLLAYIVGPFEMIEDFYGKLPVRVYTAPGRTEQGRFALEVARKSLAFYDDYFKIPYPLPKMDLIAIPDFSCGAMENWGLVTFRETSLLVDSANTATAVRQSAAITIAHELAHQWFGNLVTMKWWTHLWLNEGFATFMQYHCIDAVIPEYDVWSLFTSRIFTMALDLDSFHTSHPIEVKVENASEVDEIFDTISYKKGATIIRMLYNYIGDDSFRKGMKDYLSKFSYKNALTEDLWECLGAASGKPVRKMMANWTAVMGYPWLAFDIKNEGDLTKLTISQSKFTADGKLREEDENLTWMIPIDVSIGSNPVKQISLGLMEDKTSTFKLDSIGESWVKLNSGSITPYRTVYPEKLSQKLWSTISSQALPALDRLQVLDDYYALCQAGKVSTVDLLKLLEAFKGETDYSVWTLISGIMSRLSLLLSYTDYHDKFRSLGRKVFSEIFKKLTWQPQANEKDADSMNRSMVIYRLVAFNDESIIKESERRFNAHLAGEETIPADLRSAIYRAVSMNGNDESFNSLFEMFKSADQQEEKSRIASALGATKGDVRIKRVIELAMSDEIRNQEKLSFLSSLGCLNPDIVWKLLKDNKDLFREKYSNGPLMVSLVWIATDNFASEEMAQEISRFFEENKFPGTERTVQQSLENIRLRDSWLARDKESIKAYLSQYS